MRLTVCSTPTPDGLVKAAAAAPAGSTLLLACESPIGPCPALEALPAGLLPERVAAVAAPAVDGWFQRLLEARGILVLHLRDPLRGIPDGATIELHVRGSAIVEPATGRAAAVARLTPEYLIETARLRPAAGG